MSDWIKSEDQLPMEPHGHYLCALQSREGCRWVDIKFWDGTVFRHTKDHRVIHWMPLPEPPEAEIQENLSPPGAP